MTSTLFSTISDVYRHEAWPGRSSNECLYTAFTSESESQSVNTEGILPQRDSNSLRLLTFVYCRVPPEEVLGKSHSHIPSSSKGQGWSVWEQYLNVPFPLVFSCRSWRQSVLSIKTVLLYVVNHRIWSQVPDALTLLHVEPDLGGAHVVDRWRYSYLASVSSCLEDNILIREEDNYRSLPSGHLSLKCTHIYVLLPALKTFKGLINIGAFSFHNDQAIVSKDMLQVLVGPRALPLISKITARVRTELTRS